MRFKPWPRPIPYTDTPRKRAALDRKHRLQREKHPLLAELIAEQQPSADIEMAHRARVWASSEATERRQRAQLWRKARAKIASYDPKLQHTIKALWHDCPYPADPSYLLDLLHQIDNESLNLERPPWRFHQPLKPRVTANPATFDDAFKQIGHRKIGGGPKATPADEFIFCGNLGSGLLILTTRVRLINPNESFYTSSNHRLRDSRVGEAGHWIDLQVSGPCSDSELTLIRDLAQACEDRPVLVRRRRVPHTLPANPSPNPQNNGDHHDPTCPCA